MNTPSERHGVQQFSESSRVSPYTDLLPFAAAAATVAVVIMLLLGFFGASEVYEGTVEMMEQRNLFFVSTFIGTIAGIVETVIMTSVFTYLFAELYNCFTGSVL